jgi:hypothetical protein
VNSRERAEADLAERNRMKHKERLAAFLVAADALATFVEDYEFGHNYKVESLTNRYREAREGLQ